MEKKPKPQRLKQVDNNKGENSYKREKTYFYRVDFQLKNGKEISTKFSVRFIETKKGDFVKRRTYWEGTDTDLLMEEIKELDREIIKYTEPDRGEIQHINSNQDEFENPTDDSFFGNFLIGAS